MQISTVKAKCKSCTHHFDVPLLSDFSYGEFVYSSHNGRRYKYLLAINNKTWRSVESMLNAVKDDGAIIQSLMGHIADNEMNAGFYQNKKIICAACGRDAEISDRDNITGFIDIDEMTFDRFEQLTTEDKNNEISRLLKRM